MGRRPGGESGAMARGDRTSLSGTVSGRQRFPGDDASGFYAIDGKHFDNNYLALLAWVSRWFSMFRRNPAPGLSLPKPGHVASAGFGDKSIQRRALDRATRPLHAVEFGRTQAELS